MKTNLFFKIALSLFLFSFLIPSFVGAIRIPNPFCPSSNPDCITFEELIEKLIDFIFWVAVVIAPLMIVIAGFYFLTAAGNPERVSTAKKIIFWSVVGFVIVLLAKGIISMIKQILGG
jgi:hypothetical protein